MPYFIITRCKQFFKLSIPCPNFLLHDSKAVNLETLLGGGATLKKLLKFHGGPLSIGDVSCNHEYVTLFEAKVLEGWLGYHRIILGVFSK